MSDNLFWVIIIVLGIFGPASVGFYKEHIAHDERMAKIAAGCK